VIFSLPLGREATTGSSELQAEALQIWLIPVIVSTPYDLIDTLYHCMTCSTSA